MGFVPEEAYAVYKEAAEHDTPFSFPVTLKDKSEPFNMTFRCTSNFCCGVMSSIHLTSLAVGMSRGVSSRPSSNALPRAQQCLSLASLVYQHLVIQTCLTKPLCVIWCLTARAAELMLAY